MSKAHIIFSCLISITLLVMITPSILSLNHGKVLRNTAAWLAIFLTLGFIYKNFGPGKQMEPAGNNTNATEQSREIDTGEQGGSEQGYMPPKEE